jgi:peptidoglycan/LPS O-acetylase OafA/YrhL
MSAQEVAQPATPPRTRRTRVAVVSLVLVLAGPGVYMLLIDVPLLRSSGLPALVLMALGTGLGLFAARSDRRRWVCLLAGLECVLALGFVFVLFGLAVLPESPQFTDLESAPDFTLPDHNGRPVTLSHALRSGPVLLVFYRGHW